MKSKAISHQKADVCEDCNNQSEAVEVTHGSFRSDFFVFLWRYFASYFRVHLISCPASRGERAGIGGGCAKNINKTHKQRIYCGDVVSDGINLCICDTIPIL